MPTVETTVDAVTAALVALFAAQSGTGGTLAGVQVSDGPPARPERVRLYSYGTANWTTTPATMDGQRDESYDVEWALYVLRPGDTAAGARAEAFAVLGVVGDIVRANPSVAGAEVFDYLEPREHAVGAAGDGEGYEAVITFGIHVEAFV